MQWKIQPPECEGSYFFSGTFLVTKGVHENLRLEDILEIYRQVRYLAIVHDGLDYLQVFEHDKRDEKLFFIDQLNTEMIENGAYQLEDNHCTLMFSHEY